MFCLAQNLKIWVQTITHNLTVKKRSIHIYANSKNLVGSLLPQRLLVKMVILNIR